MRKKEYIIPAISRTISVDLETPILAGSVINQSSLEAAPQEVESYKDFGSSDMFSHNWEGGDSK